MTGFRSWLYFVVTNRSTRIRFASAVSDPLPQRGPDPHPTPFTLNPDLQFLHQPLHKTPASVALHNQSLHDKLAPHFYQANQWLYKLAPPFYQAYPIHCRKEASTKARTGPCGPEQVSPPPQKQSQVNFMVRVQIHQ